MRVIINGEELYIKFYREKNNYSCVIVKQEDLGEQRNDEVLAHGYAILAEGDRFIKEVGRKIALARAVSTFDKETRKQIWDAYHSRV